MLRHDQTPGRRALTRGTLAAMSQSDDRQPGVVDLPRAIAGASSVAFALLCATLAVLGRLPPVEAAWAAAAVALVFVPTAWWSPAGWRRRAAEAMLMPPAWALMMLGDPVQRRMLLPPLIIVAAAAAVVAAWPRIPRRRRAVAVALLASAARAAVGLGMTGFAGWRIGLAFAASAAVGWAATRIGGRDLGLTLALAVAAIPVHNLPAAGAAAVILAGLVGPFGRRAGDGIGWTGWLPGALAATIIGAALSTWGGLDLARALPHAGLGSVAAILVALAVARLLPSGAAGLIWLLAILTLGPALDPPPDRRGFALDGRLADVELPAGTGAPYVLDVRLDGGRDLEPGTAVAWLYVGDLSSRLLYPDHAALRSGSGVTTAATVWRPEGVGASARWRAAARSVVAVPAGVSPRLIRHPDLDPAVTVVLETEGPARPTPPRDRPLSWWIAAAAIAVALLQIASRYWRAPAAVAPWAILATGLLAARVAVEPLRLLAERYAVDIAFAALLAAWLPTATRWLRRRRVMTAAAALLVPLALATPHLTPPLHGDEPFHLAVMSSLLGDGDLDISDDIDVARHPQEAGYQRDGDLLHSPALGVLLLPGFAVAGRTGSLVLLALTAALALSLIFRRARRLGVPESRLRLLVLVATCSYPLATFATQIWVEIVGVAAVAAILVAAAGGRGGRVAAVSLAVVAAAVKTRLGLLVFPPAAAAWWDRRRSRAAGLLVVTGAATLPIAVGWLTMGHPFGIYRRLHHLLPTDPAQALRVLGGLAFDPSGGLLFSAPLWLVAIAGVAALWRRGGPGERMLLVGCATTVAALLHSLEWYGGGSPPARYLVPMLPAVVLAAGFILREPRRWRAAAEVLVLPSVAVWWVLVTRPHLSINPGDGGWWAGDALARSFLADTAWLLPSFLTPRPASVLAPAVAAAIVVAVWAVTRRWPSAARRLAACGAALWLLAAAVLAAAVALRVDRVVEAEAPQVRRHGGEPHPPPGTFSRFTHRCGWKLFDGDGVTVPLNLATDATVYVDGWLLGAATHGAEIELRWDDADPVTRRVSGAARNGRITAPPPPGAGRRRLSIIFRGGPHGAAVLDRIVVEPGA